MKCDCTYIFVRFMRIVWPSRILRYLLFFFPALNINRTRFAGTFPAQKTERITHTHTHTHKKKIEPGLTLCFLPFPLIWMTDTGLLILEHCLAEIGQG